MDETSSQKLIDDVILAAAEFYRRGWMWGTSGNLSVKLGASPLVIAITGSGVSKGELTHADMAVVPGEARAGLPWMGPPRSKPSAETAIHLAVYRHAPEAGAVFHVHTVASSVLSAAHGHSGEPLEVAGMEMLKGWGIQWQGGELRRQVPVLPNKASMEELAVDFSRLLAGPAQAPAVLVAGHGMTVWGRTPQEAKNRVEIAEFLCQVLWQQRLASP